jgi:hypothetical protein
MPTTTETEARVEEIFTEFLVELKKQLTVTIFKGNSEHFHKVLDEYKLTCTSVELEQLKLLYQAGFEIGVRSGANIVMQGWKNVTGKISSEGYEQCLQQEQKQTIE